MQTFTPLQWLALPVALLVTTSLLLNIFNGVGRQRLYALVALIVAIGIGCSRYYLEYLETAMNQLGIDALMFYIIIPLTIIGIVFYRRTKKRNDAEALALTPEHPFKVSVTVEPLEKSSFGLDYVRGRKLTHQLTIDVTISQKDWKRIKDAGVYDASLFKYSDTTSTHSGEMRDYVVHQLDGPKSYAGFYNITDAEIAKETLLKNLYNLKDTIALHKEGKRSESFEI
jgi:hypothetical protein